MAMTDFDRQLMILAPISLAIVAIGLVQILLPRLALAGRILLSGGLLAGAFLVAATEVDDRRFAVASAAIGFASVGLAVVSRRRSFGGLKPLPIGVGVAFAGLALLTLSVVRYENGLSAKIDGDSGDLELLGFLPERVADTERLAITDRGRSITLWRPKSAMSDDEIVSREVRSLKLAHASVEITRTAEGSVDSNCHGWVFTGGRAILANNEVDLILADNGYEITEQPRPGDLAIYRNGETVSHTAIVRAVEPGRPVVVEGKWSWMGVYRHAVGDSIYGRQYAYYRSPRADHLLKFGNRTTPVFSGAE
jgi:hypothetical protein